MKKKYTEAEKALKKQKRLEKKQDENTYQFYQKILYGLENSVENRDENLILYISPNFQQIFFLDNFKDLNTKTLWIYAEIDLENYNQNIYNIYSIASPEKLKKKEFKSYINNLTEIIKNKERG